MLKRWISCNDDHADVIVMDVGCVKSLNVFEFNDKSYFERKTILISVGLGSKGPKRQIIQRASQKYQTSKKYLKKNL